VSFSNVSAVTYKSARRGGGVVNRAGQGASPVPPSLCISENIKRLVQYSSCIPRLEKVKIIGAKGISTLCLAITDKHEKYILKKNTIVSRIVYLQKRNHALT